MNNDAVVPVELTDELDLHAFHPRDTQTVVAEFLRNAHEHGRAAVRIVHGKGASVKKREVCIILKDHPFVESFHDDPRTWGATIVQLN